MLEISADTPKQQRVDPSLVPYGVPRDMWESVKRKYFQCGGLNSIAAVTEFLASVANTNFLPQSVRRWLEAECTDESHHLMHVMEDAAARTSRGHRHTSTKRLMSFRQAAVTLQATHSFRTTPRRLSSSTTPLDCIVHAEAVPPPLQLSATLFPTRRLVFDASNPRAVEELLVHIVPLRILSESVNASHGVQAMASGKPTFDYVKGTGTLTLEQLALLLSFVAEPSPPRGGVRPRHLTAPGADDVLSFVDDSGEEHLEDVLEGFGLLPSTVTAYFRSSVPIGADTTDSPSLLSGGDVRLKDAISVLMKSETASGAVDDVLARLTPTNRANEMSRVKSEKRLGKLTSRSRSPNEDSTAHTSPIALGAAANPTLDSTWHSGVSPRRSPRECDASASLHLLEPSNAAAVADATAGILPPDHALVAALVGVSPHQMRTQELRVRAPEATAQRPKVATSHAKTQTDAPSFTLLWLGPKVRSEATSTEASGEVGRVVSLTMLKVHRHRKQNKKGTTSAVDYSALSLQELEQQVKMLPPLRRGAERLPSDAAPRATALVVQQNTRGTAQQRK